MKKIISALLAAILCMGMLAGCGKKTEGISSDSSVSATQQPEKKNIFDYSPEEVVQNMNESLANYQGTQVFGELSSTPNGETTLLTAYGAAGSALFFNVNSENKFGAIMLSQDMQNDGNDAKKFLIYARELMKICDQTISDDNFSDVMQLSGLGNSPEKLTPFTWNGYDYTFVASAESYILAVTAADPQATNTPKAPATPTPEPTPATQRWTEGQYKVGVDIQSGVYMAFATGSSGYYCISSDANGDDIIANDNFSNNDFLEVEDGQYLELSRAYAVRLEDAPVLGPVNGVLEEGMYKVGLHIPAGEYKIRTTGSSSGYYALVSDTNGDDIISNDNFDGERYINIKDGQYLKLNRCELIVQ